MNEFLYPLILMLAIIGTYTLLRFIYGFYLDWKITREIANWKPEETKND